MEEYFAPLPTKEYKVIIKCYTYNQEHFIEDALKGFVRQKVNFPFCALVVDDCSTDHNAEIIKEYEKKYPDIIKGIYLPYNMYGKPEKAKYTEPWEEKTKYIAFCEGDDYWIDDYKLQRQVDFLDAHPDYTLCFHNALVRYQNHKNPDKLMSDFLTGDIDTFSLFKHWQLPLASVVFRKVLLYSQTYQELRKTVHGGFLLFLTACKTGKVYGISECLSVYRKNEGGVSNRMSTAYCQDIMWRYAVASEDNNVKRLTKRKIIRTLYSDMPLVIKRDERGKELLKVTNNIGGFLFFRALCRFLVFLPQRTIRKIKKTLKNRNQD